MIDKIMAALPVELDEAQRAELVRTYASGSPEGKPHGWPRFTSAARTCTTRTPTSSSATVIRKPASASPSSRTRAREQAERITACRLSFFWHRDHGGQAFARDSIVDGGLAFHEHDDAHQALLWSEYVYLSQAYYSALQRHPVPLWEPALRHLAGSSLALDAYAWLAYRLHILDQPAVISWPALYAQFGGGFKAMFHFKPAFSAAIKLALAVYPEARTKADETGMTLFPSLPPLGRGGLKALRIASCRRPR